MDTTNMTETEATQQEQPSVITLSKENSINIFVQYIEIAQGHPPLLINPIPTKKQI